MKFDNSGLKRISLVIASAALLVYVAALLWLYFANEARYRAMARYYKTIASIMNMYRRLSEIPGQSCLSMREIQTSVREIVHNVSPIDSWGQPFLTEVIRIESALPDQKYDPESFKISHSVPSWQNPEYSYPEVALAINAAGGFEPIAPSMSSFDGCRIGNYIVVIWSSGPNKKSELCQGDDITLPTSQRLD